MYTIPPMKHSLVQGYGTFCKFSHVFGHELPHEVNSSFSLHVLSTDGCTLGCSALSGVMSSEIFIETNLY